MAKELKKLIEESIKVRLISDVPLGVFLSGGIDSSIIVSIMSKLMDEPVRTFSIGFEEGAFVNETIYSRFVADYYETDHTECIVKSSCYDVLPKLIWHFDDLISDPAIIPIYFMSKLAKEKMTVAITGDGADEVFAGYSRDYNYFKQDITRLILTKIIKNVMNFLKIIPSHKFKIILYYLNLSKTEKDCFIRNLLQVKGIEKTEIFPYETENIELSIRNNFLNDLDIINQMINYDLKYQLPNLFNMKTDKASMAASLETRVPFLEFIEYIPFSEIDQLFNKSKILINTSIFEGFPNTFIQSLKNKTPVISLNVNPDDFLIKNKRGFCCNNNFEKIAFYLRKLLNNKDLYEKYSNNAFIYGRDNHDIKKITNEWICLIKSILKN